MFEDDEDESNPRPKEIKPKKSRIPFDAAILTVLFIFVTVNGFIYHSNKFAAQVYSNP